MNVKQLREAIASLPDDLPVVTFDERTDDGWADLEHANAREIERYAMERKFNVVGLRKVLALVIG